MAWAYEMNDQQLVDEMAKACGKSGCANSGLVIDVMGSVYAEDARYFKGVVLSRLQGLTPPCRPKTKVRCTTECSCGYPSYKRISVGTEMEVWRVWFRNGQWQYQMKEMRDTDGDTLLSADRFEIVEGETP